MLGKCEVTNLYTRGKNHIAQFKPALQLAAAEGSGLETINGNQIIVNAIEFFKSFLRYLIYYSQQPNLFLL